MYNDIRRKIVVGMATCLAYSLRKPGKPVVTHKDILPLIYKDFGKLGSGLCVSPGLCLLSNCDVLRVLESGLVSEPAYSHRKPGKPVVTHKGLLPQSTRILVSWALLTQ